MDIHMYGMNYWNKLVIINSQYVLFLEQVHTAYLCPTQLLTT